MVLVVAVGLCNPSGASNPAVDFSEMYRVFSLIFDERLRQPNEDRIPTN